SNLEWQREVESLIGNAAVVLMRPGDSDGVLWEAGAVVQRLRDPRRLLIVLVPELEGAARSNLPARMKQYEAFRLRTAGIFPPPLPSVHEKAAFIAFDAEWKPQVLGLQRSWYTYRSSPRAVLREVLQPFARQIGLTMRKKSWDLAPAFYVSVVLFVL